MTFKLTVGLSRKIGESNIGLCDADINVEMEVDPSLVASPVKLKEHLQQLFAMARMSMSETSHSGH